MEPSVTTKYVRPFALLLLTVALSAQVYSPKLLRDGQPDSTDLTKFAAGIYAQAGAHTPREKAEAIWRFFLTDGRFVKPGFWYHIAGWTYEEPAGEVLDPMKLLNSYGFGLCYHIAPLLQAVFKAGGFPDARCWFLTGHTVTEVFYDGAYHYFDSDMMGYNVAGDGPFRGKPVVSVRDLERDGNIVMGKLASPGKVKPQAVDDPWYPADVRARAMGDLAGLFTTAGDNYLYPYTRYSPGHSMDFVLRPGEKLIRFFEPEKPDLFYLPYRFDGKHWTEFPQEFAEYHIRTADGPHSQKDDRLWATGRIEYTPPSVPVRRVIVIEMPSPYVIINAQITIGAKLPDNASLRVETSTDDGDKWTLAGELKGPHQGDWTTEPAVVVKSAHGRLTAVSGSYGYKVRVTKAGNPARINSLRLVSRIQLNPRTLPVIQTGQNRFIYSAAAPIRRVAITTPLSQAPAHNFKLVNQSGQEFLLPSPGKTGEAVYALEADGSLLTGFDAGGRFLDLRDGLAPDKLTAETRHSGITTSAGEASISWSLSPGAPFHPLWRYPEELRWRDGDPINRLLLWPEVFRQIRDLPPDTKRVYVKFRSSGPALDKIRLAVYAKGPSPKGLLKLTQVWLENGVRRNHVEQFEGATRDRKFTINAGPNVRNLAVILAAE
jgi:hypothetical protein